MTAAFLIWCVCTLIILFLGIRCFRARKPVGFWANVQSFPVQDVQGYNRACGKLWVGYGILFGLLGLPLLAGQNDPLVLLSVLGVVADTLGMILIYVLKIEPKYRKR